MKKLENIAKYVAIDELKQLENNPRQIKKADFERLKESVKKNDKFFEAHPIIASDRTGENVIIAGNMRHRAAKELGMTEVPAVILHDLTEEQEREIIIRSNVENGEWDMDALANDWDTEELESWGVHSDWPAEEVEAVEDDAPEVNESEPADSELGGVYQLGNHRLMCGDSTDMGSMAILMDGKQADLLLTDPPYNVAYGQYGSATEARALHRRVDSKQIMNDKMESEAFREFLVKAYTAADSVMREGAVFYIFHADNESYNFRGACIDMGWTIRECLIWNKDRLCLGRQDYQWKHEPCLYGWKEGSHGWYNDRKQTTVLDFDRPTKSDEHPTMKPIALFSYLIQNSTKEGDAVLDSFGGSGTTLMACEQLGRNAYIMELDPHYCDVIRKRYWKFKTGDEEGWQEGTRKVEA